MPLLRPTTSLRAYAGLTAYAGDLHNHCGISYGHGTIEEAFANAKQQLDFASVTGHAAWHDMPAEPENIREYHAEGFERLRDLWPHVQDVTDAVHADGEFVSLLSFEWHSLTYGDHCVYFRSATGPLDLAEAESLTELRARMRALESEGLTTLAIPHHIGYKRGRRGINWETYTEEFSPVIELVSMHGAGEHDQAPRKYLHTMGPRDAGSSAQRGLELGHRFGFIGSTDHHSAHPGSHGYGRAMVWADALTRDGIWDAIRRRHTYAVTGDRIMLATSVDGAAMGDVIRSDGPREIAVDVLGGDTVDYVEVLRNNRVIARESPSGTDERKFDGIAAVSVGWGELGQETEWQVTLDVSGGRILDVDPRLHGNDVVDPDVAVRPGGFHVSRWRQRDEHSVELTTVTRGNPTVTTDATQQIALHILGDEDTTLTGTFNGVRMRHTIGELRSGARSGYLGGFLSPAMVMHRAIPRSGRSVSLELRDGGSGDRPADWYYVRVRQHNDQYAWSSPTWVERP